MSVETEDENIGVFMKNDFTRFLTILLVSECGTFGNQVLRKPTPRALKQRVSGRKRDFEAEFIIPDRNKIRRFYRKPRPQALKRRVSGRK